MKDEFQSFYRPSEDDFKSLLKEGVFIFDTNVLLDLYAFPEGIRKTMLELFRALGGRIWIPYHVGLEFQRNRLSRIKDIRKSLEELKAAIATASTSIKNKADEVRLTERDIGTKDIGKLLDAAKVSHDALISAVEVAHAKLPQLSLDDPIRDHVTNIFSGRIGPRPKDQAEIDKLVADADFRQEQRIPPGYKDKNKDKQLFRDRDLDYDRRHGDLILWKQLLEQIRSAQWSKVIFVTGDRKEDWWLLDAGQVQGPRPELIQEALAAMPGKGLVWMYSTEQFLEFVGKALQKPVPQEQLDKVAEISAHFAVSGGPYSYRDLSLENDDELRDPVAWWLMDNLPVTWVRQTLWPTFVAGRDTDKPRFGIEVSTWHRPAEEMFGYAEGVLQRGAKAVASGEFEVFTLVIVMSSSRSRSDHRAYRVRFKRMAAEFPGTAVTLGTLRNGKFLHFYSTPRTPG